ncbi:PIF1-like helicase-domain-containing protein [Mrakia frigida]|uniref:PIF1-like helicase-domain-containing protein n=1 Tax=Mrakia frigida TaxID=29902 RepID=UPI003FCC2245
MALPSRLLGRSLTFPSSSRLLLSSPSFRSLSLLRRHTQPDSSPLTSRSTSFLPSSSLQQHQRRCIGTRKEPVQLSVPDMEAGFELSEEQKAVLKLVEGGESVFFTGSAGTGKSLLLKHIIKALRFPSSTSSASPLRVAVTASTGAAAVNIGGQTLHSWAGIGLGKQEPEEYWEKWSAYKKSIPMENWRTTDVLIIDEISMIDGPLFDKLEQLARLTRGSDRPFGGMQVRLEPLLRPKQETKRNS